MVCTPMGCRPFFFHKQQITALLLEYQQVTEQTMRSPMQYIDYQHVIYIRLNL